MRKKPQIDVWILGGMINAHIKTRNAAAPYDGIPPRGKAGNYRRDSRCKMNN
jgi:hypothetical protein